MIVYLESNFILELAYLQEEYSNCERILELSRAREAQLVLPAFAIAEPYSAWVGRKKRRGILHNELTRELRELGRSEPYAGSQEEFQEITRALLVSGEDEKRRLDEAIEKVLQASTLIPIEADTIRLAIDIQLTSRLGPQDSIVYASVLSHLATVNKDTPKCFVTKNSRDFANPDIVAELETYRCDLCTNFGEAYGWIRRQTGPPQQ